MEDKRKVLVICGGGMSSSFIAKLLDKQIKSRNLEIDCTFAGSYESLRLLKDKEFDLYLETPQIRLFHPRLEKAAHLSGARLVQIPPLDYSPVPKRLDNMVQLILDNLEEKEL